MRERRHERRADVCYRDGQDVGAELSKTGPTRECLCYSSSLWLAMNSSQER